MGTRLICYENHQKCDHQNCAQETFDCHLLRFVLQMKKPGEVCVVWLIIDHELRFKCISFSYCLPQTDCKWTLCWHLSMSEWFWKPTACVFIPCNKCLVQEIQIHFYNSNVLSRGREFQESRHCYRIFFRETESCTSIPMHRIFLDTLSFIWIIISFCSFTKFLLFF